MGFVKTVNIWRCDACGKEGPWSAEWRHRLILHKKGAWDETLIACSDACAEKLDKLYPQPRRHVN